jgi:ABC-type nickel/cobalt efflux system permease component RcnA
MTLLVLFATACMLGFLHALEVDHMLAVSAFVSRRPAVSAAARFGARWGLGHSVAVLAAGGVLLALGVRWPERWDAAGEAVVGAMLVGLGVWAIVSARRMRRHAAAHEHDHGDGHAHAHTHDHHGITVVGFLHGLAGTSAAVALVPVTMLDKTSAGIGYLAAFGIGVTAAMTLFAMVAAAAVRRAAERSDLWGRRATALVGSAAIVTGAIWITRALAP